MASQKLGIDNLVAVGIDAILVGKDMKAQFADGFQLLPDLSAIAFKDFGKIQNVASKAKQAWEEIKDLSPDEIEDFEVRVSEGASIPNEGVFGKVRKGLRIGARAYRLGTEAVDLFEDARDLFQDEE